MNAEQTFRSKSSGIVARLMGDFPIVSVDGIAVVGNLGHECNGFTALQEVSPTVKGSRGGFGWAQWTGPRRRAFEAYCKRNHLDPASDQANYAWLFLELKGSEAGAITALLKAADRNAKVVAFEKAFLRAGVKHYPSRQQWAAIAADEWAKSGQAPAPMPAERKRDLLVDEAQATKTRATKAGQQAAGAGGGSAMTGAGAQAHLDGGFVADLVLTGLAVAFVAAAAWLGWQAFRQWQAGGRLARAAEQVR